MKKILKILIIILLVVLLAAAAVAGYFAANPQLQMKLMTDYMFKNITAFNWEELIGQDPVNSALTEMLGENELTQGEIYGFLRTEAEKMTWEMVSSDAENETAVVRVRYTDARPVAEAYRVSLADYICRGIDGGTITLDMLGDILNAIPDAENAAMIHSAAETPLNDTLTADVTVYFEKKYGFVHMPTTVSEELNEAVTCGLMSAFDTLPDKVTSDVIHGMMELVFGYIKSFDTEKLARISGTELDSFGTIQGYPELSAAIFSFVAERAGEIEYTVGEYDKENRCVTVACSYDDSAGIVQKFIGQVVYYGFTHIFTNPIPDDAALGELFTASAAAMEEYPRAERELLFIIDPENGNFTVPPDMYDVVSANLASMLSKIATYINNLGL